MEGETDRCNFLLRVAADGAVLTFPDGELIVLAPDDGWSGDVEQSPTLARDKKNTLWMASIVRPMQDMFIRVDRIQDGNRRRVCAPQPVM